MARLDRLLELAYRFRNSDHLISLDELRDVISDYQGSADASRRKFERDKADLAKLGMVLEYLDDSELGRGYRLDVGASYLPKIELDEEERTLLSAAAFGALANPSFPHRERLAFALEKLGMRLNSESGSTQSNLVLYHRGYYGTQPKRVEELINAANARKFVSITYKRGSKVSERRIDPWGVFLRQGSWHLYGYDHFRKSERQFRVDRIESMTTNPKQPKQHDFEVPSHFEIQSVAERSPLHYPIHREMDVVVRVDPDIAFTLEKEWGVHENGRFSFKTTHLEHLIEQCLLLGPRAEIISPLHARKTMSERLEIILSLHERSTETEEGDRL